MDDVDTATGEDPGSPASRVRDGISLWQSEWLADSPGDFTATEYSSTPSIPVGPDGAMPGRMMVSFDPADSDGDVTVFTGTDQDGNPVTEVVRVPPRGEMAVTRARFSSFGGTGPAASAESLRWVAVDTAESMIPDMTVGCRVEESEGRVVLTLDGDDRPFRWQDLRAIRDAVTRAAPAGIEVVVRDSAQLDGMTALALPDPTDPITAADLRPRLARFMKQPWLPLP